MMRTSFSAFMVAPQYGQTAMKDKSRGAYLRMSPSSRNMAQATASQTTDSSTFIARLHSRPDFYFYYDFVSWSRAMVSMYKNHGILGSIERHASRQSIERYADMFGIDGYGSEMRLHHDFNRGETRVYLESESRPGKFHSVSIPFVKKGGDKRAVLWKSYHCDQTCERREYSNMKTGGAGSHSMYGDSHFVKAMLLAANKMGAEGFNVFEEESEMTAQLAKSIGHIGRTYGGSKPYHVVNSNFVKKNAIFMKKELETKFFAPAA